MKNYLITYSCAMFLLASCGSPSQQPKAPGQIDIAGKIESLTELKASDFIKEINYVALETTDSCLVNENPNIQVFKNNIIVNTKLLQKSEMRKDIVIELSYRGFSCTSDYS